MFRFFRIIVCSLKKIQVIFVSTDYLLFSVAYLKGDRSQGILTQILQKTLINLETLLMSQNYLDGNCENLKSEQCLMVTSLFGRFVKAQKVFLTLLKLEYVNEPSLF